MYKKLFKLLVKYIPIIQVIGIFINNLLFLINSCRFICYILDFVFGNSLLFSILLYVCSIVFDFCRWHRILIATSFISICIVEVDIQFSLNINDIAFIIILQSIVMIGTILSIIDYLRFKK